MDLIHSWLPLQFFRFRIFPQTNRKRPRGYHSSPFQVQNQSVNLYHFSPIVHYEHKNQTNQHFEFQNSEVLAC